MNLKEFSENRDQVSAEGPKQATGHGTYLSHETEQVLTADSPTSWALWCLSLILKEISQNLETPSNDKQPPV